MTTQNLARVRGSIFTAAALLLFTGLSGELKAADAVPGLNASFELAKDASGFYSVRGWVHDPAKPSSPVAVRFHLDQDADHGGRLIGQAMATRPAGQPGAASGSAGNHAFRFTIPAGYQSGVHKLYVTASRAPGNSWFPVKASTTEQHHAEYTGKCDAGWICFAKPLYTSKIGAWYQPWWKATGPHAYQWTSWARYIPMLGRYDGLDPKLIATHIRQIKTAGIDFLIFDNTNMIRNGTSHTQENIERFFDFVTSLPSHDQIFLSVAIGGQLLYNRSTHAHNIEADRIYQSYAQSPVYFKWRNKPLLINYNQFEFPSVYNPSWNDARFTVRNAAGFVTNANPTLRKYGAHGWWGWTQHYPQAFNAEQMGITPGADNAHRGGGLTFRLSRDNGRLFMLEWVRALKKNPEVIVLSSWNEFSDETAIEAATPVGNAPVWKDSYGAPVADWYVQIMTGYAQLKNGLASGAYYRDESGGAVHGVTDGRLICQRAMPHGRPVLLLPSGLLAKYGASSCK